MCKSVGMTVLYRQLPDDLIPADPVQFVNDRINAAPDADIIHLSNEVGLPSVLAQNSLAGADAANARGKKVCAYNVQTNQSVEAYKAHLSTFKELTKYGNYVGVHLYLDGDPSHDAGGYAPLDFLLQNGIRVLITEYGYIYSITDAHRGYRYQHNDPAWYNAWFDSHAAKLASYGYPAFVFSIDQWQNNDQGKAEGFGTEDHPEIHRHLAPLNAQYPIGGTPVPPQPDYPAGTNPAQMLVNQTAGVKLRPQPTTSIPQIRVLAYKEEVTRYAEPIASADGYTWYRVTDKQGNSGWCADPINNVPSFVPVTTPEPPVDKFTITSPLPQGVITAHFNQPRDYDGDGILDDKHEGTDWALTPNPCAIGEVKVLAAADGVVESVRTYADVRRLGNYTTGYGVYVKVKHVVGADTFVTWYCHLSAELVCKGQTVKRGDPVGVIGTTGNSTGYHVHLNLQHIGHGLTGYVVQDVVDPEPYLVK